jgi:hypothetical protein
VNPKEAIIGIHKDKGQTLESLNLSEEFKKKIVYHKMKSYDC